MFNQVALSREFENKGLRFKRENYVRILYKDARVGRDFNDFLVEDKVVVELKVDNGLYENHLKQLLAYLKSTGKRLGILAVFTPKGVIYQRVIN